jgi:hypothetical protein
MAVSSEMSRLQRERRRLIRLLTSSHELAVGSVARVRRKCGNPRCGCLAGQGHPQTIFLYTDDQGRRRCKLIRRADEAWMHKAGDRYRKWRKALNRLRAIENRQRQILLAEIKGRAIFYE